MIVGVASADKHDTKFKAVPDSQLQIRAVEYDGTVNGTLKVQVKNTGKAVEKFSATGLYFVPEGDPDSAPQRLGAVGPMVLDGKKEMQSVDVAAGATVDLALDVFCIDSQRPAPTTKNVFDVGTKRLPKEMSKQIEYDADEAVAESKKSGEAQPRKAAKGAIQGKVWKSRDDKWIDLDGEGKQEIGKKKR
ncbi:MAG: hypothetical protein QM831_13110 [Kofleriaceae bacterium]